MTTQLDVLTVAASQIGTHEDPLGSNHTPYGAWYGLDYNAWCAMFVSWCFDRAGLPLPASSAKGFAWCPSGESWFDRLGLLRHGSAGIASGHVVFYSFEGVRADHVELVESVTPSTITTIGGNVSDRVGRWTRSRGLVRSYGMPLYGPGVPPPPPDGGESYARPPLIMVGDHGRYVALLQGRLNRLHDVYDYLKVTPPPSWSVLLVDGSFGSATERTLMAMQRANGVDPDGVYGPDTDRALIAAEAFYHLR